MPNQCNTRDQRELNVTQSKNKCFDVSKLPQDVEHAVSEAGMLLRLTKLSLVGNRSRRSRHTNKETFKGISRCQTSSIKLWSIIVPVVVI
jgi:hypothetical protein